MVQWFWSCKNQYATVVEKGKRNYSDVDFFQREDIKFFSQLNEDDTYPDFVSLCLRRNSRFGCRGLSFQ
jgi:hypothetical protein